ncbi:MAG: hypothetical protein ACK56Q_04670, partial [Pirellulaceae bacterium]
SMYCRIIGDWLPVLIEDSQSTISGQITRFQGEEAGIALDDSARKSLLFWVSSFRERGNPFGFLGEKTPA